MNGAKTEGVWEVMADASDNGSETPSSSLILDRDVLDTMVDDLDSATVRSLVQRYVAELLARTSEMAAAAGEARYDHVADEAHALKSSSATFGAGAIQSLAHRIEEAGRGSKPATVVPLVRDLPGLARDTAAAMSSWLGSLG